MDARVPLKTVAYSFNNLFTDSLRPGEREETSPQKAEYQNKKLALYTRFFYTNDGTVKINHEHDVGAT